MRTSAFTIVELLVSLVISSLVISMAWSIYFFLGNYREIIEMKAEDQIRLKQFEYWITSDLSESSDIEYSENGLVIHKGSGQVTYHFTTDYVFRIGQNSVDSLLLAAQIKDFRRMGSFLACASQYDGNDYCFPVEAPGSSYRRVNTANEDSEEDVQ